MSPVRARSGRTRRAIPTVTLTNKKTGEPRKWSVHVIKRMLVSARISGRRERVHVDGVKRSIGIIVNDQAEWAPIITTEKSDALRRLLGNPDRRRNGKSGTYLLTHGISICGVCGKPLVARPRGDGRRCMVCASGPGFHGCGKIRTLAEPLENLVVAAVLRRIDGGALARAKRGKQDAKLARELVEVEGRLEELARQWAKGEISSAERAAARQILVVRKDALNQQLDRQRMAAGLDGLPPDDRLGAAWPTLELHRQRGIVNTLVEKVTVNSAVKGRNTFDHRRVDVTWRA